MWGPLWVSAPVPAMESRSDHLEVGETHEDRRIDARAAMTGVPTYDRRLDTSPHEALTRFAEAGAAAFGHSAVLTIDRQLAQLLRLRVAQIGNCSYCLGVHHAAARAAGIPQAKIDLLTAWWETGFFTVAEQAALQYAEALTRASDTSVIQAFQRHHDALAAHFDATEMVEIVGVMINMNVWIRLKLAAGATPFPPGDEESARSAI